MRALCQKRGIFITAEPLGVVKDSNFKIEHKPREQTTGKNSWV